VLIFICRLNVYAIDNGIYSIERENSTTLVTTSDGEKIKIGQKVNIKVEKCYIHSTDNVNETFHVNVNFNYNSQQDNLNHVLVINGIAYKQSGSGRSNNKLDFSFVIKGKAQAENAGKYFKTKPFYRKHPAYQLETSFIPEKSIYAKNEELWVKLRIKNVGNNVVSFQVGGRNRAARDNQYSFLCYLFGKQVNDIGTTHHFGGRSIFKDLKPGEVFENRINLSKWFSFNKEGFYEVLGSYYMAYRIPNDNIYRILWEDYATAEFYIRIK